MLLPVENTTHDPVDQKGDQDGRERKLDIRNPHDNGINFAANIASGKTGDDADNSRQ